MNAISSFKPLFNNFGAVENKDETVRFRSQKVKDKTKYAKRHFGNFEVNVSPLQSIFPVKDHLVLKEF